jgi:hypothetical protein
LRTEFALCLMLISFMRRRINAFKLIPIRALPLHLASVVREAASEANFRHSLAEFPIRYPSAFILPCFPDVPITRFPGSPDFLRVSVVGLFFDLRLSA